MFCYKLVFSKIDKPDNRKRHFLKIKYINGSLDFLNISGIHRNPEIHKIVPSYSDKIETSILSYYYKDIVEGRL